MQRYVSSNCIAHPDYIYVPNPRNASGHRAQPIVNGVDVHRPLGCGGKPMVNRPPNWF